MQTVGPMSRFVHNLSFDPTGRPRGWVLRLVFERERTPRSIFRRVVYKRNGRVRPHFETWMLGLNVKGLASKPGFEKIHQVPAIYYRGWLEKYGGTFVGKEVLDFGCGEGLATVGLSLFCGARSVVGVEIGDDFLQCSDLLDQFEPSLRIPENVSFRRVAPAHSLGREKFDVIVSWSVLEHVSQDVFERQLKVIYECLRIGGYCVFQVAPLYFSSLGSHLFGAQQPWDHLTKQVDLLRSKVYEKYEDVATAENLWDCFLTLNRFTSSDFCDYISASGLKILGVYETYVNDVPSPRLLEIYRKEVLTKEQILLVCKK